MGRTHKASTRAVHLITDDSVLLTTPPDGASEQNRCYQTPRLIPFLFRGAAFISASIAREALHSPTARAFLAYKARRSSVNQNTGNL